MPADTQRILYQFLAKMCHPDGHAGDELARRNELMKRINQYNKEDKVSELTKIAGEILGLGGTTAGDKTTIQRLQSEVSTLRGNYSQAIQELAKLRAEIQDLGKASSTDLMSAFVLDQANAELEAKVEQLTKELEEARIDHTYTLNRLKKSEEKYAEFRRQIDVQPRDRNTEKELKDVLSQIDGLKESLQVVLYKQMNGETPKQTISSLFGQRRRPPQS